MLPLARAFQLTYIARSADLDQSREAATFLNDHGIKTVLVNQPLPLKRGGAFYARLAANLVSPLPYSVQSHTSEKMRRAVSQHAARNQTDVWQLEWSGYGYCIPSPTAPVVLQAHNIDALIWQRYRDSEPNWFKRKYIADQYRKYRSFERQAFSKASCVVAVSEADAQLARSMYGTRGVEVIDNGVDVAAHARIIPGPSSHRILFLGALDWRPNLDAVTILLDKIFPSVKAKLPGAILTIVGRSPPPWLRQRISEVEGAELCADVPTVAPYLASSSVMAVPLRIAGGSRLKILEALASGLPVVSTTIGAEGLLLEPDAHLSVADRQEDFVTALIQSLVNPGAARAQAERGRKAVSKLYDWNVLAERLGAIWQRVAEQSAHMPQL
jgi:glycosyltransferase involved in cell wall biosynthesis